MADEITPKRQLGTATNSTVVVSETPEAVADRAAADFTACVQETLSRKDRVWVTLPGGKTPQLFFTRLTQAPYSTAVPWDKVWFFWGDERCVPPEHPESNFGLAQKYLLEKVPVKNSHVFRIRGEDPPAESGRAYSKTLHEVIKTEEPWPRFDIMILGMGADGHTASLLPGTSALQEERRWVVENVIRSLQTVRITMTLPVINHARHIWFLVTGTKKGAAFDQAQSGPHPDCPASLVHPVDGELVWYVDKAVVQRNP